MPWGGSTVLALAEQAPQGRHIGAVLGRQTLVPHRTAVAGAEDIDMRFGIERINQTAPPLTHPPLPAGR